jgi:hypothetical protein
MQMGGLSAAAETNLGFLATLQFRHETQTFSRWISLDFLGFSRPNRDLSMGYSGQTATKFFLAPPPLEAPRGRDFRMGDARRWSFRKATTISDLLQSIA